LVGQENKDSTAQGISRLDSLQRSRHPMSGAEALSSSTPQFSSKHSYSSFARLDTFSLCPSFSVSFVAPANSSILLLNSPWNPEYFTVPFGRSRCSKSGICLRRSSTLSSRDADGSFARFCCKRVRSAVMVLWSSNCSGEGVINTTMGV
jgi:hypothetical protein